MSRHDITKADILADLETEAAANASLRQECLRLGELAEKRGKLLDEKEAAIKSMGAEIARLGRALKSARNGSMRQWRLAV